MKSVCTNATFCSKPILSIRGIFVGSSHSELVRALINLADMNASDIATTADLTPSTVSRYLNAKTDIKSESLLKILKCLGIDLGQILRKELLNKLNGRSIVSRGDDDLLLVMQTLNEIDQKTILNTIIDALPSTAGMEAKEASGRLATQARGLAIRKRRYA